MIEVEKQCQPAEDQIKAITGDSEFLGEKIDHDIYYDYPDYSLLKEGIQLRYRNGSFELKIAKSSGVKQEIEIEKEIEKYFKVANLNVFVKERLIPIVDYEARRRKYKQGDFNITLDEMNFGYSMCEIELMVPSESEVKLAEDRIVNFAGKYGISMKKINSKRKEYFRLVKPEVYKELYPNG